MNKQKPTKLLEDIYAPLYTAEREWALVGLLHFYISTPSTVTHIFNHHTPTPELSPTPSTVASGQLRTGTSTFVAAFHHI